MFPSKLMSGKVKKVDQVFSRSTSKMACKALRTTVVLNFGSSDESLINENGHNCRTSNDIDMKLGPATKLDKRNEVMSKKLPMLSCQKIVTSSLFFQFTVIWNNPKAGFR